MNAVLKRVWLVCCDHSVTGVWRTRREAQAAMRMWYGRAPNGPSEHFVVGPYVLQQRGGK